MPQNPKTGKTDHRALSEAKLLKFCLKQAKESGTQVKKGKRCVCDSPEADGSEGSGPAPSPLATLAGLGTLALDSSGSSAANTPADSPATFPQPPLLEHPAPAPPLAPKTHHSSKSSAGRSTSKPSLSALTQYLTGVMLEVPGTSKLLISAHWQVTHSYSNALSASDDGSNIARIAALKNRQEELEKQMHDFDHRLKQLGR